MKTGRFCPSLWRRDKNHPRSVTSPKTPVLPVDPRHALKVVANTKECPHRRQNGRRWGSCEGLNLGFQSPSIKHNREAPMRFIPTPPAFDDNRKITIKNKGIVRHPRGDKNCGKRTARFLRRLVEVVNEFLALLTWRGSGRIGLSVGISMGKRR